MMMDEPEEADEGPSCTDKYEAAVGGVKFIKDADQIAGDKSGLVYDADSETPYGIRNHPDMNVGMCFWSILVPWHVDWIPIILFLGFTLYFWVQLAFVTLKTDDYRMKSSREYDIMTIATIGVVIGLTCSTLNFLFFSISERARGAFATFDFMGRMTMVFLSPWPSLLLRFMALTSMLNGSIIDM